MSESNTPERTTLKQITHFKATVCHEGTEGTDGIICYWATFREAAKWVAGWPHAIEAHITREPMNV